MASTTDPSALKASCHCGRIAIALPSPPEDINECHCSVCYKLGAMWAYYPREQVAVTASSSAFPTSIIVSPHSLSDAHEPRNGDVKPITRGINTAVDEALDSYVRADLPGDRSGTTFYRCAHCGTLTHWWNASGPRRGHEDHSTMGVNCRLLPESKVEGVKRMVGSR
ncbi:hypothetical protein F5Y09DRAFT_72501 [Xylaria sp. FL1042]|nr:hypothetical protein F5Y09DRAFT_72501 [Xylaria sp. FL1042]